MQPLIVNADWDEEAGVWVATSDDIVGLATEAETLDLLRTKLVDLVPELLFENGNPGGEGNSLPVEIVARQRLLIDAA